MPTIYSSVFELGLSDAIRSALITSFMSFAGTLVCALLIDQTGRRLWFTGALLFSGAVLLILWAVGARSAIQVLVLASAAQMALSSMTVGLYLYTPELYPTRLRALGSSVGSAWLRIASVIGPAVVGFVVARAHLAGAFLLFGIVLLVASGINRAFGTETKGQILEKISP